MAMANALAIARFVSIIGTNTEFCDLRRCRCCSRADEMVE
jgi:hypothetical protein